MSFPNYPNKQHGRALLNPQDIVNYRRHLGRLPKITYPPGLLFCLERGLPRRMRRRVPVRSVGRMFGELYLVKNPPGKVGIMSDFGGGAPIIVELAEEFVVLGTQRFVLVTWGGALQPDLQPGDIVVCDRGLRDEGVSHHYLPPEKFVLASEALVGRLVQAVEVRRASCTVGATWTTDAPYRETLEEVQQYRAEGILTVEMEAAGLFALGQVRGVQAAALVVVMDRLGDLRWEVPDSLDPIQKGLEIAYQAAIDALTQP